MNILFYYVIQLKLLIVTILLVTTASKSLQKTSPCPTVFSYDEKEDTSETWYGTLRLKTNVPLHGIFIDVIFDGQVFVFGVGFSENFLDLLNSTS